MRQIKGSPKYQLLPSKKDPRKFRWQRIEPEQKEPQGVTPTEPDDEETRRYKELMEVLRNVGKKSKQRATQRDKQLQDAEQKANQLEEQLQELGVSGEDAKRISLEYLVKRVENFFREGVPYPLPDYPYYPKELERIPPNPKPVKSINPGYVIKVLGVEKGDETGYVEAATEFIEYLFGVLREIHPLPKTELKIYVAVPYHTKSLEEFKEVLKSIGAPMNSGWYFEPSTLIVLKGFRSLIHEIGHFIDLTYAGMLWSGFHRRVQETGQGAELLQRHNELTRTIIRTFLRHWDEIVDLNLGRHGISRSAGQPLIQWLNNDHEKIACAYEQYVLWKLRELGRSDLAQLLEGAARRRFTPLIPAELFKPIKDAFDAFFDAVRKYMDDKEVLKWLWRSVWVKF
jgi:hypothetical protein